MGLKTEYLHLLVMYKLPKLTKYQLVQVKEEHKLISRLLIVYRAPHETDLPCHLKNTSFQLSHHTYLPQIASFIILKEIEALINQSPEIITHASPFSNEDNTQLTFTCSKSRKNIRKKYEICSKLTIKTPERRQ